MDEIDPGYLADTDEPEAQGIAPSKMKRYSSPPRRLQQLAHFFQQLAHVDGDVSSAIKLSRRISVEMPAADSGAGMNKNDIKGDN